MREALRLSFKDLGACFCGSPLRCLYFLAVCLCCQVDLAHHSLAQLKWVFIPGTVLWPERQDLAGKQQPHSDHMAVESPSPKKERCCFQEDSGGLAVAAPEMLVHIDGLRKVCLKPELISQPESQDGNVEGTLGWNLEARVESQLHHLVIV